jgi:hypothetical protein
MSGWRANAEGQVTLAAPPRGEFEIHASFGWIRVVERHRLPARAIAITLPPFGSVEVKPVPNADPRSRFVRLVALTPGMTTSPELNLPERHAPSITDGIPAGSYRADLVERTPQGGSERLVLTGPTVEVKDGERCTIDLASPR